MQRIFTSSSSPSLSLEIGSLRTVSHRVSQFLQYLDVELWLVVEYDIELLKQELQDSLESEQRWLLLGQGLSAVLSSARQWIVDLLNVLFDFLRHQEGTNVLVFLENDGHQV